MSAQFRLKAVAAMVLASAASATLPSAAASSAVSAVQSGPEAKKQALLKLPGSHYWSSSLLDMDPFNKNMTDLFGSGWEADTGDSASWLRVPPEADSIITLVPSQTGACVLFRGHKQHLPSFRVLEQNVAAKKRAAYYDELDQSSNIKDPYPSWDYGLPSLKAFVNLLNHDTNRSAVAAVLNATFVEGRTSTSDITLASDFFSRIMPLLEDSQRGKNYSAICTSTPEEWHLGSFEQKVYCVLNTAVDFFSHGLPKTRIFWAQQRLRHRDRLCQGPPHQVQRPLRSLFSK